MKGFRFKQSPVETRFYSGAHQLSLRIQVQLSRYTKLIRLRFPHGGQLRWHRYHHGPVPPAHSHGQECKAKWCTVLHQCGKSLTGVGGSRWSSTKSWQHVGSDPMLTCSSEFHTHTHSPTFPPAQDEDPVRLWPPQVRAERRAAEDICFPTAAWTRKFL